MGSGSLPIAVESEGGICIVYIYIVVYIYILTPYTYDSTFSPLATYISRISLKGPLCVCAHIFLQLECATKLSQQNLHVIVLKTMLSSAIKHHCLPVSIDLASNPKT